MRVRVAIALLLIACQRTGQPAPAPSDTPQTAAPVLRLELERAVGWGYGCGGHCAFNTSGKSKVELATQGDDVHLGDEGELVMRQNDPGGGQTMTTRWQYGWHGTASGTRDRRTFRLHRDTNSCDRRTQVGEAEPKTEGCSDRPPTDVVLQCAVEEITLEDGAKRQAWQCRPESEVGEGSWTPWPWVFGANGDRLETRYTGEPRARTTYVLR